MDKEAVGEFVDSIVMAPERGGVDEKAEGFVWVLRRRSARTATSRTAYAQQRESMKIIVDIGHARKTGAEGNGLEEHEVSCVVAGYLV